MSSHSLFVLSLVLGFSTSTFAQGQPFQSIRIGDRDGFGFGDGAGLLNFQGQPVNVDGVDVLSEVPFADFLPDLNQDGFVQDSQGDDFDNRSAIEIAGNFVTGTGFADQGTMGSQFTDISLSQSFDVTFPPPNNFPDPPAGDRNDAHFAFRFFVADTDIPAGNPIFFNVVFGDIGLVPAELTITFANGSSTTEVIDPINPTIEDGLIRGAVLGLAFADVFTGVAGGWSGFADVVMRTRPATAEGDPYYALDYVELNLAADVATCQWYCGTGLNAATDGYVATNPAVIGGTFIASVTGCDPGNAGSLLVGYSSSLTLLSVWGELLVNFVDPNGEILGMPLALGSPAVFALPVPNDPAVSGFVFYTQAASFGGSICLHCAYECTVGW